VIPLEYYKGWFKGRGVGEADWGLGEPTVIFVAIEVWGLATVP
jgi:hypothetical protein